MIILGKEYASSKTIIVALGLVPASKRLLGSDTPQGNTEQPRSWAILSKYTLTNSYLISMGLGLKLDLSMRMH